MSNVMKRRVVRRASRRSLLLVLLLALCPARAAAQFDGPRSYWKAPVNTHSLGLWYMRITGNTSFAGALFERDASATTNLAVASYNGYFGLFGRSAIGLAVLPAGRMNFDVTGEPGIERSSSGLADGLAILDVNLVGAPAMSVAEFSKWQNRTVIDVNFAMSVPTGSYASDRLLNLGTNRWAFRVGFPLTQGIGAWEVGKRTTLEIYPYIWFFTDNDDFLDGRTKSQDPMVQIESHLTRDLTRALWASVGYLYLGGGKTEAAGHESSGSIDGHYIGATLGIAFTSSLQLVNIYGGTVGDGGGMDFNLLRIQLQYTFNPDAPKK